MSVILNVPLSSLISSRANVRKRKVSAAEMEELKASIAAHGMWQNLVVVPDGEQPDPTVTAATKYRVVAGSRRYLALKELVKDGVLEADMQVSCRVILDGDADPGEISLAENMARVPLHPSDQIDEFGRLHKKGKGLSVEQIAERFGHKPRLVEQRLRLAEVHPDLIAHYRSENISLEVLTAFTLSANPKEQLEAYDAILKAHNNYVSAYQVQQHFIKDKMTGETPVVKYVTIKKYEEAGGTTTRDLFAEVDDRSLYIDNTHLINKLALEKLEKYGTRLLKKWKWVECIPDSTVAYHASREYDTIQVDYQNENDEHTDEQRKVSGVILYIGHDGKPDKWDGLLRSADKKDAKEVAGGDLLHKPTAEKKPADPEREVPREVGYNKALVEDLRMIRTNIARCTLADHPDLALDLLTYQLARQMFDLFYYDRPLGIRGDKSPSSPTVASEPFAHCNPGQAEFDERIAAMEVKHADWLGGEGKKKDPRECWKKYRALPAEEKAEIGGLCIAATLHSQIALDLGGIPEVEAVLAEIDPPFHLLKLNAVIFWNRVPKPALLEIMAEVSDTAYADSFKGLKKGELAAHMEKMFADPASKELGLTPETQAKIAAWVPAGFAADESE